VSAERDHPFADHVDPAGLEAVDGPTELGWSFDRRQFLTMMGVAGGALALGAGAASATPAESPWVEAGTTVRKGVTDPVEYTVAELVQLYRRRRISPREVVQAYLDRIALYDADYYKAYVTVVPELALQTARDIERIPVRARTALWGVPYAPKDNFFTEGILTTANSDLYQTFVPDYDATYVARLKASGAILLGKTAMGPLASGRPTTPNGVITTRNAWSPDDGTLSPSGSSGGSGCAPAARLAPFCLGTQTGGSITSPTQANALTGLKPTLGRTSVYGVIPLSLTRDHTGPMGRNVKDIAITMTYSDGPDTNDPRTIGVPKPGDYVRAATPVRRHRGGAVLRWATRLGVPPLWVEGSPTPNAEPVRAARAAALETFRSLGAEIVEIPTPPDVTRYSGLAATTGESSECFREELRGDLKLFNGRLTGFLTGLMRGADHYITARRAQYLLSEAALEQIFDRCDALISPPSFDPAGFPLIAFPIGFNPPNPIGVTVPIGMIIGGRPYDEVRILSLVAAFQAVTDFHLLRPPDPTPAAAAPAAGTLSAARFAGPSVARAEPEMVITPEELYEIELAGLEA
jgi:Asp-tRNA(Asn)/Glu-tRNA(Gln) amidotransferase A subunit family amidase